MRRQIPHELHETRVKALRALGHLRPLSDETKYDANKLFLARRTEAGRNLPPYYLVYFLLADLLEFPKGGPFDKTAWSIPVEWQGKAFLIDHRKMGLGIFAQNVEADEAEAKQIAIRIHKAVKAAQPFFDWMASDAIVRSAVNVTNNSSQLFGRFTFLRGLYFSKREEYERQHQQYRENRRNDPSAYPPYHLASESNWCAISAVEAFFAWSEHVLIHVATLTGRITTAAEISEMAEAEWSKKFRAAFPLQDAVEKAHYDRLIALRQELRNHVAHGAFGKQGEAFYFHSAAGAVPVLLPHKSGSRKFRLASGLGFNSRTAFDAMDSFVEFLWAGERAAAKDYIQESELPIILTYAKDGTYANAMSDRETMKRFIQYQIMLQDRATDMDW